MIWNAPNLLTIGRIAAIPPIVGLFYFDGAWTSWTILVLFSAAGISDYLDGWLARRKAQMSDFGRFLDPIADKLLVGAVLVMLCATDRVSGATVVAVVLILSREILVSGLREFLAGRETIVPVSPLAKWKTTIQLVALGFAILGTDGPDSLPMEWLVPGLMWAACALTLVTGYDYLRSGVAIVLDGAPVDGR